MQVWCMISQYIPINIPSLSPLLLVNNTLPLLLVHWLALEAGVYGTAMFLQAPAPKRGGNCWQNWRFRKLKMLRWSMHLVACVVVLQFNPMSKLSWCEVSKYILIYVRWIMMMRCLNHQWNELNFGEVCSIPQASLICLVSVVTSRWPLVCLDMSSRPGFVDVVYSKIFKSWYMLMGISFGFSRLYWKIMK